VGLVDSNGHLRDEYAASEIFNADASTTELFNASFPQYVKALLQGINISVFLLGSTSSGRTHTMVGKGSDLGLVQLLGDSVFSALEEEKYRS
jgi:hypothetical protein